jgi:formylglycine-generating enzyme required for sulfatase activity
MAPEVFISYSQGDEFAAERVRAFLEGNGFSCWIASRDIPAGQDFGAAIAGAIRGCRIMVLVFSSRANTSRQISRELKLADDSSRIVVPLRIEDIPASGNFAYFLGAAQWIEAVGGPNEEDLQRLTNALGIHLGREESLAAQSRPSASPNTPHPPAIAEGQETKTVEPGKPGNWWLRLRPRNVFFASGLVLLLAAAAVWRSGKIAFSVKPKAGTIKVNPADGQKYVWVPPGSFRMGCSDGDTDCSPDERPVHRVSISKGFWMERTEVPVSAYRPFYQQTGRAAPASPPFRQDDDHPAVNVDWSYANAYCNSWAGGRLPTEAEWEYAARAGTTTSRYGDLDTIAWHKGNSNNTTHPVGQKAPNAWGLYDMLGSVWEWCSDWYGTYSPNPATDPEGPETGQQKVGRGGSFFHDPNVVRVSVRGGNPPGVPDSNLGFRCVRDAIP